ncbi:TPA: hypothetical protein QDZ42_001914 [Stenotrophomonas maltophilia]|nr:hypothetical protein [Stenotrophomonas maltophilia]HDS1043261.1 hypothetical protein [Stenotrophomonas maltophilia]
MTALLRMLSAALLALAGEVHADAPTAPPVGSACVEVVVNGERVPDYNCLSRQLSAPAAATAPAQLTAAERLARQPPSALGLANRAATQQRMGNAFGVSTQPQRPPPPPPPRAFP